MCTCSKGLVYMYLKNRRINYLGLKINREKMEGSIFNTGADVSLGNFSLYSSSTFCTLPVELF